MGSDDHCSHLDELTLAREELARSRSELERTAEALASSREEHDRLRARARDLAESTDRRLREQSPARAGLTRRARKAPDDEAAQVELLRSSDLFDPAWYLLAHPEVVDTGLDPARHYLRHGAADGWDPSPAFSTDGYLREHPDVAAAGTNPLVARLRRQARKGRGRRRGGDSGA